MNSSLASVLDLVLDPEWLSTTSGRPAEVTRIRLKPDTSILAAIKNPDTGIIDGWVRILWPISHNKADITQAWADAHGHRVTTTKLSDDLVFQTGGIHTDPKLAKHLHGITDFGRILRYNPARRVVFRDTNTITRITVSPDELGLPLHHMLSMLVPTPPRLDDGSDPRRSVHQVVSTADLSQSPSIAGHVHAGEILAKLHLPPKNLSTLAPHTEVLAKLADRNVSFSTQIAAHADIFDVIAPDLAQRIRRTQQAAAYEFSGPPVVIHGDASPDQLLVDHSNHKLWITDFDRVRLSPAVVDLGSYLSVTDTDSANAMLNGYAASGNALPTPVELTHAQAQAMLLRIAEPLRTGSPDWRTQIHTALDNIDEVLA